ncbi:MAG TPA: single-stranded DNA-binding protein [Candidatus Saccharimonadales bacterium]|nr:single-stranded DNA-binding protein [Candidatus Saccharimonadales bacterium]
MAKGFNKVILMGNLTRDPETRQTPNGQSVTNFSLAVNRTWKGQDGNTQEAVSYIDCVAWGRTGEIIAQYMQKGRPLLVSGRLDQRSWEQDGNKRSKVEVIVEDFNFVGGGDGGSGGGGGFNSSPASAGSGSASKSSGSKKKDDVVIEDIGDEPINLDDIPF